jgi:hypothetical protein
LIAPELLDNVGRIATSDTLDSARIKVDKEVVVRALALAAFGAGQRKQLRYIPE